MIVNRVTNLRQLLRKESRAYLAGSAGGQALGEGIQEAGAGLLQRAVAKGLYDPSLDVGESIFDEFTVGASVGAFVDLMSEVALPRSRYRTGFDKSGKAIEVSYNESESTEEQIILADEQENAGKKQQKKQHKIHREDILNLSPVVEQGRNGWNIVDKKTNRIIEVVNQEATAINQVNRLNREIKDAKRMAQVSKDANELGVVGNSTDQSILIQTSAPEYSCLRCIFLSSQDPSGECGIDALSPSSSVTETASTVLTSPPGSSAPEAALTVLTPSPGYSVTETASTLFTPSPSSSAPETASTVPTPSPGS